MADILALEITLECIYLLLDRSKSLSRYCYLTSGRGHGMLLISLHGLILLKTSLSSNMLVLVCFLLTQITESLEDTCYLLNVGVQRVAHSLCVSFIYALYKL